MKQAVTRLHLWLCDLVLLQAAPAQAQVQDSASQLGRELDATLRSQTRQWECIARQIRSESGCGDWVIGRAEAQIRRIGTYGGIVWIRVMVPAYTDLNLHDISATSDPKSDPVRAP
jgi:hypothetical protein